jgi:hypothetical protein
MMAKYLIFSNDLSTGKRNKPGTPEAVACDIARAVDMDESEIDDYIAYTADMPEATLEVLKRLPIYSIELTKGKIDSWNNDALRIFEQIENFKQNVEDSRESLSDAVQALASDARYSELFNEVDFESQINFDDAFDSMVQRTEYVFSKTIKVMFGIKRVNSAEGVTT